jgi:hypothetical protein
MIVTNASVRKSSLTRSSYKIKISLVLRRVSLLQRHAYRSEKHPAVYRVSQEECARLREGVPYVKVYRYNSKHLCPKLNSYGDYGQRKVWSSLGFHALYLSADSLMHARPSVWCHITAVQLTLSLNCMCTSFRVIM